MRTTGVDVGLAARSLGVILVATAGCAWAGVALPALGPAIRATEQARVTRVPIRSGTTTVGRPMWIEHANRASSKALMVTPEGRLTDTAFLLRSAVVVRTTDGAALQTAVNALTDLYPGMSAASGLDDGGQTWAIETADVRSAVAVANHLGTLDFISHAVVDSGPWIEQFSTSKQLIMAHQEKLRAITAPGLAPVGEPGARGLSFDPLVPLQWHLDNALFPGRDLNVIPVYQRGITGAGVTVAIADFFEATPQRDHEDYAERLSASLSQPYDPNLPESSIATFFTGLLGATAGNGLGGQGVAPGVTLATMITGTELLESKSYAWLNNEIDIKVHLRGLNRYIAPDDGYAPGAPIDYVMTSLENSMRLGRGGKGVIHVFSTGSDGFFPSPYLPLVDPAFSGDGWQDIFDNIGEVGVSDTNGYLTFPLYPGGLIHNYPPAGHRNTFVIAGVGEDNVVDPFSTMGTGVFASVYSSSVNDPLFDSGNIARGLTSTTTGDGYVTGYDATNNAPAAIAAGVFALMLEANPNLTIRDIQHIIADTAVTAGLGFDPLNPYVSANPFTVAAGQSGTSNWDTNGAFKLHSDQYGFGLIDADAAVAAAENWTPPGRQYVLDSGLVTPEDQEAIPDAELIEVTDTSSTYLVSTAPTQVAFCVRENFQIEVVEVELTLAGDGGGNDLIIELFSPYGTASNLHYPMTVNTAGTTFDPPATADNENDTGAFSNLAVDGTNYAFYRHKFVSYKHWDELSGGRWIINIWDVGPDEALTEGEEGSDTDPAVDHVTDFGFAMGVPPNPDRSEKTIESYRIRIYGTLTNELPFFGCAPGETNCPADLNGDGVVNYADLEMYMSWYTSSNLLADMDGSGVINFTDISMFIALWQSNVGFCGDSGLPFNRPVTEPIHPSDPVIRPM